MLKIEFKKVKAKEEKKLCKKLKKFPRKERKICVKKKKKFLSVQKNI